MTWTGRAIPRFEDHRFITGAGQYVDDLPLDGACEMAVVRSPFAHANVDGIDLEEARAVPGVVEILTAGDLGEANAEFPVFQLRSHPGITNAVNHGCLAGEAVRFVGEAVAAVFAETRVGAREAARLVSPRYEPLAPTVSLEDAELPAAAWVHERAPRNVAGRFEQSVGDIAAAFRYAAHVVERRLRMDRGAGHPIEPRTIAAIPVQEGVEVWTGTQVPHRLRDFLAPRLGLKPEHVRIRPPDTGGAFGVKGYTYPEDLLAPFACLRLGRPVRWVEERREHSVATFPERTQSFEARLALDDEGMLLGLDVDFVQELGAYLVYGFAVPQNTANHIVGPYRIPAVRTSWRAVYTNVTPSGPYRGAGRPQGAFVIERLLDAAARSLHIDPVEIRRQNLIEPTDHPYDTGLRTPVGSVIYDSGDYPACLQKAIEELSYDQWRRRQADWERDGRMIGLGVANYVEFSITFPFESASVEVITTGDVEIALGASHQGQGYETTFAQLGADVLAVHPRQVRVIAGDTGLIDSGGGNYGSRVAITAGSAAQLAAHAVRDRALDIAGRILQVSPSDLVLSGGIAHVPGAPASAITLGALAVEARDSGGGLSAVRRFEARGTHVSSGTHAVAVEVDGDTGQVTVLRYVVVHDCGTIINPMIVEGQIRGAVAQGLGGCFMEQLVFDSDGQPLTTSLMDYRLPTAWDIPDIEIHHIVTPSPNNPLGVKGAGEGGIIPVYAVIAAAVEDAIGTPVDHIPVLPADVHAMLRTHLDGDSD